MRACLRWDTGANGGSLRSARALVRAATAREFGARVCFGRRASSTMSRFLVEKAMTRLCTNFFSASLLPTLWSPWRTMAAITCAYASARRCSSSCAPHAPDHRRAVADILSKSTARSCSVCARNWCMATPVPFSTDGFSFRYLESVPRRLPNRRHGPEGAVVLSSVQVDWCGGVRAPGE